MKNKLTWEFWFVKENAKRTMRSDSSMQTTYSWRKEDDFEKEFERTRYIYRWESCQESRHAWEWRDKKVAKTRKKQNLETGIWFVLLLPFLSGNSSFQQPFQQPSHQSFQQGIYVDVFGKMYFILFLLLSVAWLASFSGMHLSNILNVMCWRDPQWLVLCTQSWLSACLICYPTGFRVESKSVALSFRETQSSPWKYFYLTNTVIHCLYLWLH